MIENNKIFLTKLMVDDEEFYTRIYTGNTLMAFVTKPLTAQSTHKSFVITLKKMSLDFPKLITLIIKQKKSNQKLGIIALKWNQKKPHHVEIGIIVLAKFQRKGIAHQAKKLIMSHAFECLKVEKIIAICDKDNIAANKANKKLGFEYLTEIKENNKTKIKWGKSK